MTYKELEQAKDIAMYAKKATQDRKVVENYIATQLKELYDDKIWLRVSSEAGYTIELSAPVDALRAGMNTILAALRVEEQKKLVELDKVKINIPPELNT